jgi:hypothetical protein
MAASPLGISSSSPAASAPWFAGLLVVALIAFWPTYLSRLAATDAYTHLHAVSAALWMVLLVAQPLAIRTRRLDLHRAMGRASWVLAPFVLAAIVLLAHSRLQGLDARRFLDQTYVLYLQVSLAALWSLCYGLAIAWRRTTALHARFMVCTGLTLIDPVAIRLMFWIDSTPSWNYQWLTFGLTDLVLAALIAAERRSASGRGVFPAMLALFVLLQAPPLLGLTASAPWQSFSRWFAALPLT